MSGILDDLGIEETELVEALDHASTPARTSSGRDAAGGLTPEQARNRAGRIRTLADWATSLRESGRPPEEIAEILSRYAPQTGGWGVGEVREGLRLARVRAATRAAVEERVEGTELPPLEEGLSDWLDGRVGL